MCLAGVRREKGLCAASVKPRGWELAGRTPHLLPKLGPLPQGRAHGPYFLPGL